MDNVIVRAQRTVTITIQFKYNLRITTTITGVIIIKLRGVLKEIKDKQQIKDGCVD